MLSRRLNIVIFDEDMGLCDSLSKDLQQLGHHVIGLPLEPRILARADAHEWDLGLLGIPHFTAPGMDFHRRLRNHRGLRELPLIVISDDSTLEYELLDTFDFQLRPVDRSRLRAIVEQLAGQSREAPRSLHFDSRQIEPFKTYLIEHTGLHFSQRNQRMLERGLQRRMQALQSPSPAAYLDYLASADNQDELNKLLRFLTVGETCFFRYRSHRDALQNHVLPQLIKRRQSGRSLRIWSAGCSTGEEPYSLTILLLEHFPHLADWDIRIIATDINKRALRQAREGVYGRRALRLMDPALQRRYFEQIGPHFKLRPLVRSMVRFNYLNLQTDPFPGPPSQTAGLDLLLCRNVLIYFRLDTIRRIVDQFADSLKPDGYLFLGHAETMQNVSDRYLRLHEQGAFFYQLKKQSSPSSPVKPAAPAAARASTAAPRPRSPAVKQQPRQAQVIQATQAPEKHQPPPAGKTVSCRDLDELYAEAVQAFDREQFGPAEEGFDRILASHPDHSPSLVGKGLICANRGDYTEARKFCARAIARDDLFPPAYLLRGLILDMEGHLHRAMVEYQKILWLDSHFVMANYLLAKIHARLGQWESSRRALRNTLRALERSPDQAMIPFSGGLTRSVFLELVHAELDHANSTG